MKKFKKFAALGLAALMIIGTMAGCAQKQTASVETSGTKTETAETKAGTAAETKAAADTAAETKTAAESAAESASEAKTEAETATVEKVYESKDGWKIKYFPNNFDLVEGKDGVVSFLYKGKSSGKDAINISYHPGKLPSEVLYDKTGNIPDERVTRSEGWFGSTYPAWTFTRDIAPGKEDPASCETYTGIEHNGGTLLVDIVYYQEKDDDTNMDKSDQISGTVDTLELVNHKPQQEMAYKVGTYVREYKDEIEGEELTFTDTITLNEDHTGVISFQDDIDIIWSSYELIERDGDGRYEYTVEGDNLYVNMNDGGDWVSFERKK